MTTSGTRPAQCIRAQKQPRLTDARIGAIIRIERQNRGIGQNQLSRDTGIDVRVLSRIELGQRPCRATELSTIAAALPIPVDKLLEQARQRTLAQASDGRRRKAKNNAGG
ncbi:helix-turn-helix transcriptional regulator [Mycolicibacterium fortuitum]|uniref:helix-turn-helix domain-containing protein n=1 Tax=Mycolicibacterium TaxID=1866885 RepID=UPI003204F231